MCKRRHDSWWYLANTGDTPACLPRAEYFTHWQHQRQVHAHLLRGAHAFPGSTAVVAMVVPAEPAPGQAPPAPGARHLYVANAGDCRAVLVRSRRPLAASRDHTGLLEDERERLAAAGLHVTWQHGGWRIGSTGLQVTRCIGDFDVKGVVGPDGHGKAGAEAALGSGVGVTAVPEVTCVELQPGADHFLVLASDGLWDVMSVQEAAGLVYDTVKDPVMAAKRLVCEVRPHSAIADAGTEADAGAVWGRRVRQGPACLCLGILHR